MDDHAVQAHAQRTARIAELNDRLRRSGIGGRTAMTRAVADLPPATRMAVIDAVRSFTAFAPHNDPHGERDFGQVAIESEQYFWKIDYFDFNLEFGSPDPADETITCRVMTIMTALDL